MKHGEDGKLDVEELCRRYGPMVLRRCQQLLRDEDEAMDVSQDLFVRLLKHRATMRVRHPSSLLYRMATNLCLNRIRDRGRRPTTSDEELLCRIASSEDVERQAERRSALDWVFQRHPTSSRTIAVLHYLDGLTLEQVAEEVGLSVSGVRKRLRGLRQTLLALEKS